MPFPARASLAAAPVLSVVLALSLVPVHAASASDAETGRALAAQAPDPAAGLRWKSVNLPKSKQSLRGLDAVSPRTAWVSGDDGGVWRTTDAGKTWKSLKPTTDKVLTFRDIEATSTKVAQVLAIGPRAQSRILRTVDGGKTWTETFRNAEETAFYDCMAMFADGVHGLAMSDPVDGRFRVIATADGGATWSVVDPAGMPEALEGEYGFAASGTCLVTAGTSDAWLATGGPASRVFHSTDYGLTWTVAETSIPPNTEAGGVFSLAFRNPKLGIAVGGNFLKPGNGRKMSSRTGDGGATWIRAGNLGGYRSGVAWVPHAKAAVAVGPEGTDFSVNGGRTWSAIGTDGYHAVQCVGDLEPMCWASGYDGAIARLVGLPKG